MPPILAKRTLYMRNFGAFKIPSRKAIRGLLLVSILFGVPNLGISVFGPYNESFCFVPHSHVFGKSSYREKI